MNNKILLTYFKEGKAQFDLFSNINEIKTFIEDNKPDDIFRAIKIIEYEEIEITF